MKLFVILLFATTSVVGLQACDNGRELDRPGEAGEELGDEIENLGDRVD